MSVHDSATMLLPRVSQNESESGNDVLSSMGLTGFSGRFFSQATQKLNQEIEFSRKLQEIKRQSQAGKGQTEQKNEKVVPSEEPYSIGLLKLASNYKRQIDAYNHKSINETLLKHTSIPKQKAMPYRNQSLALENSYIKMYQKNQSTVITATRNCSPQQPDGVFSERKRSEDKIRRFKVIRLPDIVSPRYIHIQAPHEKGAFGKLESIFRKPRNNPLRHSQPLESIKQSTAEDGWVINKVKFIEFQNTEHVVSKPKFLSNLNTEWLKQHSQQISNASSPQHIFDPTKKILTTQSGEFSGKANFFTAQKYYKGMNDNMRLKYDQQSMERKSVDKEQLSIEASQKKLSPSPMRQEKLRPNILTIEKKSVTNQTSQRMMRTQNSMHSRSLMHNSNSTARQQLLENLKHDQNSSRFFDDNKKDEPLQQNNVMFDSIDSYLKNYVTRNILEFQGYSVLYVNLQQQSIEQQDDIDEDMVQTKSLQDLSHIMAKKNIILHDENQIDYVL